MQIADEGQLADGRGRRAASVTAFVCANCCRPGQTPDSSRRPRPTTPRFHWPFPVQELFVPCTGRLQPEHILKAFENGADLVCTVACRDDNCHYVQGSQRWARRVDYLRVILDEVGLGGRRLMLFHLPGTAAEDTALGAGRPVPDHTAVAVNAQTAAIRDAVLQALHGLTPNPLRTEPTAEAAEQSYYQLDTSDEANED